MNDVFILFGYKSSGKTSVGKILAAKLSLPFVDTDRLIEELYVHEKGQNLSCREISKKEGEAFFRTLEQRAINSLNTIKKAVISLGGGVLLDPENRRCLAKMGQLIYLETSKEVVKKRLLSGKLPSFIDAADPEGSFEKMYAFRKPIYESMPALQINTDGKSEQEIAAMILHQIQGKKDGK